VFVSGEPYYLQQSFKGMIDPQRVLSPVLNFSSGYGQAAGQL
jgi:hypothetical protein